MDNLRLAESLKKIAELMELKGENFFKIKAYEKGASTIERLSEPVADIRARGRLSDIPGIGKGLAEKIVELLDTGSCSLLQELEDEFPAQILELMRIPGLGPKKAAFLYREAGIATLADLDAALAARKLEGLKGFGAKTVELLARGIEMVKSMEGILPLYEALEYAAIVRARLEGLPSLEGIHALGGLARGEETSSHLEFLLVARDMHTMWSALMDVPGISQEGERRYCIDVRGLCVRLILCPRGEMAANLVWYTGSEDWRRRLSEHASQRGLHLDRGGIEGIETPDEESLFSTLDLPLIPLELRETGEVIDLALEGKLPVLVTRNDLKGDLHCHTSASDGADSLEEIVAAALARGYRYLAVTDHSQSLRIAKGLEVPRMLEMWSAIDRFNGRFEGLRLLKSSEVDILPDGTLDYPDDLLRSADIITGSVHSAFRQDRSEMTRRIIRALENPYLNILGHPTGRIIGRRPPYEADWDAIFQTAGRLGKAMEINSFPDRLDLNGRDARKAAEAGAFIAVSTDSHSRRHFDWIDLGLTVARRGWLETRHVINTWEVERLLSWSRGGERHTT
jgi:DNA polymerase (family 10)